MLRLHIKKTTLFDEEKEEFVDIPEMKIELEHSLASLSKWESIWKRPFLTEREMTNEETLSYVECMLLTPDVPPEVIENLTNDHLMKVQEHIAATMTATTFRVDPNSKKNDEIITAEIIYQWMVAFNIPFDPCEYWHLDKLITLVKVCNEKSKDPKKRKLKQSDLAARAAENARRRAAMGTTG